MNVYRDVCAPMTIGTLIGACAALDVGWLAVWAVLAGIWVAGRLARSA